MLHYLINYLFQDKTITIIINVLPLIWTIYHYHKDSFKSLNQNHNQLILKQVIVPFYESIELHLFEEITEQNKQERLANCTAPLKLDKKNLTLRVLFL